jgi:hypothetical protein
LIVYQTSFSAAPFLGDIVKKTPLASIDAAENT